MSRLTEEIERQLGEQAGLYLAVQEDDEGAVVVSGMVGNAELRAAALDIVREFAGEQRIVDDIEIVDAMPDALETTAEHGRLIHAPEGVTLEPGDFASQELLTSAEEASGPEMSLEEDLVSEGDEVFVPPVDPPLREGRVVGGLEFSALDDMSVEESSDHTLGDEAIREAVLRELREDAITTEFTIEVEVIEGLVRLSGQVPSLDDAESAEEVASRVPGVVEVEELLEVVGPRR
jgi:osmotically-inducible protein OsmY